MVSFDPHLALQVLLVVVAWEAVKRIWDSIFQKPEDTLAQETVPDSDLHVKVPADPHFEFVFDPPRGLHFSNSPETYPFETSVTTGTVIVFHAPTGEGNRIGLEGFDFREYFQGKSRLWEVRVHMKFKRPLADDEELFFGIELDQYVPVGSMVGAAQHVIVGCLQQIAPGVYHTTGDDPSRTRGECERPACMLPLWAFDQFIVTPEGEEPPSLAHPHFSELGSKRYKRVAEYAKEIKEMVSSIQPGPTYTFGIWGASRFMDALNWKVVSVPVVGSEDFNKFAGRPPVSVTLYSIKQSDGENKHYQSRKTYFFKTALWSSKRRPPARRISELLGTSLETEMLESQERPTKSLKRRFLGLVSTLDRNFGLSACTSRPDSCHRGGATKS
jgi:hypothetical protein